MKSTNKPLTNQSQNDNNLVEKRNVMLVLNAIENAIVIYGRKHPMIGNPYWWFAQQCGYKSKNHLYHLICKRENYKLTIDTIQKVYQITKDENIIEALKNEVTL